MVTSAAWDVLRDVGALQTVTLHVRGTPSVDITTGVITQTDTAVTITDALVQRYSTREVDGIRITAGDRRLQFPQASVPSPPQVSSTVIIDSVSYDVIAVQVINQSAAWDCQVRRIGTV